MLKALDHSHMGAGAPPRGPETISSIWSPPAEAALRTSTIATSWGEPSIATSSRELGILLPNNQRQHRTLHTQQDVLPCAMRIVLVTVPVSAILSSIFRMDSISASCSQGSQRLHTCFECIPFEFGIVETQSSHPSSSESPPPCAEGPGEGPFAGAL